MAKHAELSPSSAERWMHCPGSVVLSRGLPNTNSDFSDEGTAAHYLASVCLTLDTNAAEYLGREIYVGEWGEAFSIHTEKTPRYKLTVGTDFAEHVQSYLDYVRGIVNLTGGVLHVEQRLSLENITGEEDAGGTSDAVIITDDELIVVDLKFGKGVKVEAEGNPQLGIYGLAAMDKYEIIHDFKLVRKVIHQPRLGHVSEEVQTLDQMSDFRGGVNDSVINVRAATHSYEEGGLITEGWFDSYLKPSEDACRWCKAKATCPKLSAYIEELVGADFEDLTEEATDVKGLDPEELSLRLKSVGLVEGWCKAVRAGVESLLLLGTPVPDFKLVQGRKGNKSWDDEQAAEAALKAMRLKVDEMYNMKLATPTAIEKVLKDSPKRWNKIIPLIVQRDGGPSVAPASDKRPAMVITPVADDMVDLTDELDDLVG